jgi:hypothetical protein
MKKLNAIYIPNILISGTDKTINFTVRQSFSGEKWNLPLLGTDCQPTSDFDEIITSIRVAFKKFVILATLKTTKNNSVYGIKFF